jgi:hypothetical protein
LGIALDRGDTVAPERFVAGSDPLVRALARWRLRSAYANAQRDTGATAYSREAALHALGVTYLRGAGEEPRPLPDPAETEVAVRLRRTAWGEPPPLLRPWVFLGALGSVAAVVAAVGLFVFLRHDPREGPGWRAVSQTLPDWVAALDRWAGAHAGRRETARLVEFEADLERLHEEIMAPAVVAELGAGPSSALDQVLSSARTLAGEPWDPASLREVSGALRGFNRAAGNVGLPWFLDAAYDGEAGYTQVGLFVYEVAERRKVAAGRIQVDTLHVHRLDRLHWARTDLGFTERELEVALVSLDAVEEALVAQVGPALGAQAEMPVAPLDCVGLTPEEVLAFRSEAGRVVREAWDAGFPEAPLEVRELGRHFQRRAALLAEWQTSLAAKKIELDLPAQVPSRDAHRDDLERLLGAREVRRLAAIEADILEHAALYARMLELLAATVERHEVQHRLDYARGEVFPVPSVLSDLVGSKPGADGKPPRFLERVSLETSAYLAELARAGGLAHLELLLLARFLFEDAAVDTAEWYAAMAIVRGLADELGAVAAARWGRPRWAGLVMALTDTQPSSFTSAAAALWKRWYGGELPELRGLPGPP